MGMIGNSLAQGLISGANIVDGTVDTPDIKDSAVTAAKIANGVVTPGKLSTGAPTWDSSGNFGIGAATPANPLHVSTSTAGNSKFEQTSTAANYLTLRSNGSDRAFIGLENSVGAGLFGSGSAYGLSIGTIGASDFAFITNNTVRGRFNSSGEMLVGTSSNLGVGARVAIVSSGNVLHIQSSSSGANNFVSYNSSGSAAFVIGNNGSAYSNGAIQATSGSSTTGLIVAQSTGASATQYGRFTANSADVSIGQNIATSPGSWSKIDTAVASAGWVFNGRTASLWTSSAGTTSPLEQQPIFVDTYGNIHLANTPTTFQQTGTDNAHTIGQITSSPSTVSRLNIQERAGAWISWVNGGGGFYGAVYLSGSNVVYGGASDYRLKENIQPMQNAIGRMMRLNPVTFRWIESQEETEGFIAHEVQEVVPHAVVGEKDGINENGDPKWQAMDATFIVPLLTKAMQEQQAIIEALTERITALEAA